MDLLMNRKEGGSYRVMADVFMALTVILISTSVMLPKQSELKHDTIPSDVKWLSVYKKAEQTCVDKQCYGSLSQAFSTLDANEDYLLIPASKTNSHNMVELVQFAQTAGFKHLFLEQGGKE